MTGAERECPMGCRPAGEAGRLLAAYGAVGAAHNKLMTVRDFADGLLKYEAKHASGPETPTLVAVAHDLIAILEDE